MNVDLSLDRLTFIPLETAPPQKCQTRNTQIFRDLLPHPAVARYKPKHFAPRSRRQSVSINHTTAPVPTIGVLNILGESRIAQPGWKTNSKVLISFDKL